MKKVLFIGESWMFQKTEYKGFDSFTVSGYEVATKWMKNAVEKSGYEFVHIPSHLIDDMFPKTVEELQEYHAVFISDVGYNTFKLSNQTFHQCKEDIDKLQMLRQYTKEGGNFCMIGGYLSFQGFEGKGHYHASEIEEILPVHISMADDRVELPSGYHISTEGMKHKVLEGLPETWPMIMGYNKLSPKEDAEVVVRCGEDPILVLGKYGEGKTVAFATDCSPHWASEEFCEWEYYPLLWGNILAWMSE